MTTDTYLVYLAALAAFFLTPPDTSQLLIISNSMRFGVRRSLWVIVGDLTANSIQMAAAAFGLAAIVEGSAELFVVIKWLGVAYLIGIGAHLFLSKPTNDSGRGNSNVKGGQFRQGFITSCANPYAVVFFGALFPQFIDYANSLLNQLLILGVTYLIVDGMLLVAWGIAAEKAVQLVAGLDKNVWVNRCCGALMIGAASLLALKNFDPTNPA